METESPNPSERPIVLIGVAGGISAYKTVDAARLLHESGADVHVAMTSAAHHFVEPDAFEEAIGRKTITTLWTEEAKTLEERFPHLYPATDADCFVLAPATADIIAKIVHGEGNDVVTTSVLSLKTTCRKFFCPAMNVEMWHNEVVQRNVRMMEDLGWNRIGPNAGPLACGMEGEGRMAEPEEIAELAAIGNARALAGKLVLILSGPTREHLDPVRFLGNPSSGKMGKALAEEAAACGASVQFVSGPVAMANLPRGRDIEVQCVTGATQMLAAADARFDEADVIIYAAAVADYSPANTTAEKLPKKEEEISLRLVPTPDIASTLNARKRPGQVAIGFALQSHDGEKEARSKLERKKFDGIVLNYTESMNADAAAFEFLSGHQPEDTFEDWGTLSKHACARRIIAEAICLLARA